MKSGPMSLQYCLAVAACEGKMTTAAIDGIVNPCTINLMSKIKVIPDASIAPLSCKLTVAIIDHGTLEKEMKVGINNLANEVELIKSLIPEMKTSRRKVIRALDVINNMEACKDISRFVDLLVP